MKPALTLTIIWLCSLVGSMLIGFVTDLFMSDDSRATALQVQADIFSFLDSFDTADLFFELMGGIMIVPIAMLKLFGIEHTPTWINFVFSAVGVLLVFSFQWAFFKALLTIVGTYRSIYDWWKHDEAAVRETPLVLLGLFCSYYAVPIELQWIGYLFSYTLGWLTALAGMMAVLGAGFGIFAVVIAAAMQKTAGDLVDQRLEKDRQDPTGLI